MLVIAFLMGIVYSVPLGPLGQIMLNKAINKGFWHGFSMAIIGAGANFVYAFAFLMGTGSLIFNSKLRITIQIIGLLFLLYVGAKEILIPLIFNYKKKKSRELEKSGEPEIQFNGKVFLTNFFTVMSYFISNPTIVAFWINMSALINLKLIHQYSLWNYALFSSIFSFGTLTCQYLAILIVKRAQRNYKLNGMARHVSLSLFVITVTYFIYLTIHNLQSL